MLFRSSVARRWPRGSPDRGRRPGATEPLPRSRWWGRRRWRAGRINRPARFCVPVSQCPMTVWFLRVCKGRKFDRNAPIKRLAFCTGSGGDLIDIVKADLFLTGDLKYHQAMSAVQNNLTMLDIGHFESERYFGESLAKYLQILPIPTIISNSKNPFSYS